MLLDEQEKKELKELAILLKMDRKYSTLVEDGLLPVDEFSLNSHLKRRVRINELMSRFGMGWLAV